MSRWSLIAFIPLSFALAGCNGQVSDFVRGGGDPFRQAPTETLPSASSNGFKVSGGRVTASAAGISAEATVSPTRRTFTGTGVSAELTLSGARPR